MNKVEVKYRVPYADTDKMGVVYYANYLIYFEITRNEILREAGMPYSELEKSGFMLPVIEAVCHYKAPAQYDDLLTFTGWVDEVKGPRIKIFCEVHKDEKLLVSGYTVHACVNTAGKPVRPPESILSLSIN
ncbi:MAG: hypothetical protein A2017_15585 [Lentisphaerae bacterium GWF2_44_16]|nr:MAG: hypothetical protein A2017_15585 [Lentisphaerae bacterium GWF2_44_16]